MIEDRDSWETPKALWRILNYHYRFEFDCCATSKNTKCKSWSVQFENNFELKENLMCWINPPFSKAYEMIRHFFLSVNKGVGIYRCDNIETKVWQNQIFKYSDWVFIFNKRVEYEGQKGKGARFPSALFGVNCLPPNFKNGKLVFLK